MTLRNDRHLSAHDLRRRVSEGEIDTVVVAFTDMQGRLQGKRMHGAYFVEHVLGQGTEGCNYLLAVDIDMNTVDGYAMSSWESGYGDLEFALDLDTLRLLPHLPGTAMVQCDLVQLDHSPVPQSPRTILATQLARAAELGYVAQAGTELEFLAFDTSFEAAWASGYRDLAPVLPYNGDYSILGTTRVEPLLRTIRNAMYGAGMDVESAKGECNLGQQEIGFLFAEAMITADNHAVYKTAAKEIAHSMGKAITFLAKYDQREGNSCHIHLSLRGADGETVFDADGGRTALYDHFLAGLLATMHEFTLLYAPNVNSYKRFAAGSFAPTTIAWGSDNRTCALRVVGHGAGARVENRVPGGDVNPYLALAAMVAGGLYGIEHELELPAEMIGNAHTSGLPTVPRTLREARDVFSASAVAREVFGDEVVEHYTHAADIELTAFDAAVTDWELRRGFERM
ncbi:glutamine synthetase family protein [uncultured Friedmanniella sp.]|uniref:glutamine synthetase family protein n=1 Tax=uncultured Friedmanniella sp. TaxID=335381 RepID=UPI0035CC2A47